MTDERICVLCLIWFGIFSSVIVDVVSLSLLAPDPGCLLCCLPFGGGVLITSNWSHFGRGCCLIKWSHPWLDSVGKQVVPTV